MTNDELASLVREYQDMDERELREDLNSYNQLSREDSLRYFALAEHMPTGSGRKGKRRAHQRRIHKGVLPEMEKRFRQHQKELLAADDFVELHDLIRSIRVPGYGATCIYDAALLIGWQGKPQVVPQKIYLHAGPLVGARNLGLDVSRYELERSCLPPPLRELECFDVEHFLCIYAKRLDKYEWAE